MSSRSLSLLGIIALAVLLRVWPHPWNFSPIAAMALFSGCHFRSREAAFAVPLGAMVLSDAFLGFYPSFWLTYGCFALTVLIGTGLKNRRSAAWIAGASVSASVLFFLVTNFGVWQLEHLYRHDLAGLAACYTAGIPFFQGTLAGDLVYTAVLFGAYRLVERAFPQIEIAPSI